MAPGSKINLPSGGWTSNTSPAFNLLFAKAEKLPLETSLTVTLNSPLSGAEHREYARLISFPSKGILKVVYCQALKEKLSFNSRGISKDKLTACGVSLIISFIFKA